MKKTFAFLPFLILACGQETTAENTTESNDTNDSLTTAENNNSDDLSGTYEFVNPYNSLDLIHNHYIILEKGEGENYSGRYYGVTDMFDPDRTEYAAGYFVLPMTNLKIEGEQMSFELIPTQEDFFNETIELSMNSSDDARAKGFTQWEVYMLWEPKKITAQISGGIISLNDQPEEMTFIPMN